MVAALADMLLVPLLALLGALGTGLVVWWAATRTQKAKGDADVAQGYSHTRQRMDNAKPIGGSTDDIRERMHARDPDKR